jgi:hypothetical protein
MENYLDLIAGNSPGAADKWDKSKEEKELKFVESVLGKRDEDKKHEFKLKWKEKYEDLLMVNATSNTSTNSSSLDTGIVTSELTDSSTLPPPPVTNNSSSGNGSKQVSDARMNTETRNSALDRFESEYRSYLESFLSVVAVKLKALIEKSLSKHTPLNPNQALTGDLAILSELNHEVTRHLMKLSLLWQTNVASVDSDEYLERFKRLIASGVKQEHYPIFVYGLTSTGKTNLIARFSQAAEKMQLEASGGAEQQSPATTTTPTTTTTSSNRNSVIRFLDLTTQCSTFEGVLNSLCQQLILIEKRKISSLSDLKSNDLVELIEQFFKLCASLTANNKSQLFIFIDGLSDINVEKSMVSKSNLSNNQISWLFHRKLPAGCHMVVSIKRQSAVSRSDPVASSSVSGSVGESALLTSNAASSTVAALSVVGGNRKSFSSITNPNSSGVSSGSSGAGGVGGLNSPAVSLFLNYFNEYVSNEIENSLFETPMHLKRLDLGELVSSLKNKIPFGEESLRLIVENIFHGANATSPGSILNLNYFYFNFLLRDLMSNPRHLYELKSQEKSAFPKDLESYVKFKIGKRHTKSQE